MSKITALLPMKANSTRVPGKNFKIFHGKPLFQWILESLLTVKEINQVVINTDAKDLIMAAGNFNSERIIIRDRKPDLCGDEVSMNLILNDDVKAIDSDIYVMTHTTNPLLSASSIQKGLNLYMNGLSQGKYDSLFTVNRHQARFYDSSNSPINHDPQNLVPTQNLEPFFEENSNLYIFSKSSFLSTNARIGSRPMMQVTPRLESVDIDTEDDWDYALAAAKILGRA